jgi:hypothetical protein
VIAHCHDLYELRRAREWTEALTHWCEQQPDMVAHTGVCLVHRAEIFGLQGAWANALEEARRARERCAQGMVNRRALGEAVYLQAEVHRMWGEFGAADDAYREASRHGREPQPGWRSCGWPREGMTPPPLAQPTRSGARAASGPPRSLA